MERLIIPRYQVSRQELRGLSRFGQTFFEGETGETMISSERLVDSLWALIDLDLQLKKDFDFEKKDLIYWGFYGIKCLVVEAEEFGVEAEAAELMAVVDDIFNSDQYLGLGGTAFSSLMDLRIWDREDDWEKGKEIERLGLKVEKEMFRLFESNGFNSLEDLRLWANSLNEFLLIDDAVSELVMDGMALIDKYERVLESACDWLISRGELEEVLKIWTRGITEAFGSRMFRDLIEIGIEVEDDDFLKEIERIYVEQWFSGSKKEWGQDMVMVGYTAIMDYYRNFKGEYPPVSDRVGRIMFGSEKFLGKDKLPFNKPRLKI